MPKAIVLLIAFFSLLQGAPITYTFEQLGSGSLGGTPFTDAQLAERYADRDAYVAAVTESAERAVADGFLLQSGAASFLLSDVLEVTS